MSGHDTGGRIAHDIPAAGNSTPGNTETATSGSVASNPEATYIGSTVVAVAFLP